MPTPRKRARNTTAIDRLASDDGPPRRSPPAWSWVAPPLLRRLLAMGLVDCHERRVERIGGLGAARALERWCGRILLRLFVHVTRQVLDGVNPILSAFRRIPFLP